jgi:hypothetical protein
MDATTSSSFSLRRPSTTACAPSPANRRAISAPSPVPPPETTMVRPFSKSLWNILVPRIPAPANEVPKALVVGADGRIAVVADAQSLQVSGDE